MCTVSVVPAGNGFRVVCNRDEQLVRPAALPPTVRRIGVRTALWPLDPVSGGTWIGVNDAGIAMFVLNRTVAPGVAGRSGASSRGTLVPELLRHRRLEDVMRAAANLPLERFEPFTLVAVSRTTAVWMTRRVGDPTFQSAPVSQPLLFTSSSLGDDLVTPPRRQLFARLVERSATPLGGQLAFHRHTWPARPNISVQMSRGDAATVSRTLVDVTSDRIDMRYVPILH
jgi:hypothetical protein